MKRWRTPSAKPGELKIAYGKEKYDSPELMFCYGGSGATKRDTNMLMYFFCEATLPENKKNLVAELESRGFDITTLKFSIQQKVKP